MKRLFALVLLLTASTLYGAEPCELVRVVDGDTIVITMNGSEKKVRLCEIDAPETRQEYGPESKAALISILKGKELTIDVTGTDVYGRTLARVYADGKDVGLKMIKAGAAWPYKHEAPDPFYRYAMYARWNGKGLWKNENPVTPWDWRKNLPEETAQDVPESSGSDSLRAGGPNQGVPPTRPET